MRVPLYETRTVQLNGSGNGTARATPLSAREVWYPENVHVSTIQATVTNEAVCKIYVGYDTSNQYFRDNTFTGSTGDATDKVNASRVTVSDHLFAVWTGGDPNVFAVMVITGEKEV